MRLKQLGFVLLAVFVVFIGGSSYYNAFLPVRVITHVALTALLVIWLVARIRSGRFLPATPLNAPLFAGVVVLALAAAASLDPRMAVESLWWPLVHLLIFFFLAAEIAAGRQRRLWETQFLLAALAVIFAGIQLLSWWFGWGFTPETGTGIAAALDFGAWLRGAAEFPPVTPMLYLPLGVSTWLAAYTAPQIVMALAWARTAARRDERIALAGLAALLAVVLAATGSRGGFLALAAAVIVFLLLRLVPATVRNIRSGEGGWGRAALSVGAVALVSVAALGVIVTIGRSSARSAGDELRGNLWKAAITTIEDHPLLGVGAAQFGRAARLYREPGAYVDDRLGTAHNIVLNTGAESGIAGVLVLGWMALALLWGWYRLRRAASGGYALRLDAVLAALAGFAVQSLFDTFTVTAIVVLVALLAAYAVTAQGQARPARLAEKIAAWAALALVIGFGLFWIPVDMAQARFQSSLRYSGVEEAEAAAALDPGLHLYPLQSAWMNGTAALSDSSARPAAIDGLEAALAIEPTWDTGWVLLAGLYEQAGQIADALTALERAGAISTASAADWNWARIADAHDAAPDADIITAYIRAMGQTLTPFSPSWAATPRRLQALEAFYAASSLRMQYLLAEAFFPERRAGLVPADPQTADDWWVVGQHALTVDNDAQAAWDAFNQAVRVNPNREFGEYYAARARAGAALGPEAWEQARRDAAMAEILYTLQEQPAAALAQIGAAEGLTGDALRRLLANAAPPLVVSQNFEGVLFGGRTADFQLPPALRPPGPGVAILAPLFALADDYWQAGEVERVANVFRYILELAPEETRAAEDLSKVAGASSP